MDKLDKYIDGLFHDKLSGAERPDVFSDVEWMRLQKTIRYKNFFRFNVGSFNVYYLSFVVSAVVILGAIIYKNLSENPVPTNNECIPVIYADTLGIDHNEGHCADSIQYKIVIEDNALQNVPKTQKSITNTENNTISRADSIREETFESDVKPIGGIDTGRVSLPSHGAEKLLMSPPKADTLIIVDTVKVIKKQIKFQRKSN
jgi:hypothetical protein